MTMQPATHDGLELHQSVSDPIILADRGVSEQTIAELERPPDPGLIGRNDWDYKRPHFEYISGADVIRTANKLFGTDGWQYMLTDPMTFHETDPRPNAKTGKLEKTGFYRAQVSVQVRGIGSRDGVACSAIATNTPLAHDTAMAGALTKAIKRAFRTLGPRFGLDLKSNVPGRPPNPNNGRKKNYSGNNRYSGGSQRHNKYPQNQKTQRVANQAQKTKPSSDLPW